VGGGVARGAPTALAAPFALAARAFDFEPPSVLPFARPFASAPAADDTFFALAAAFALDFAFGLAGAVAAAPLDAAAVAGDCRPARLLLRRTGLLRGRLVMTSRSESSPSGTMRMMSRALRRPPLGLQTNHAPTRTGLQRRR
jgi:hypothetical protein